jgi:threonine/homoserine/homoserine lactone efflux protein
MLIVYFFIGLVAATIAAMPPGAANLVVMSTTTKQTLQKALLVALGAGIGEVLLSLIALHCTINFTSYFEQNPWIQITFFSLFVAMGLYFLLRNRFKTVPKKTKRKSIKAPKIITGILLAFVNPPVLIFWVLTFTIIQKYLLQVSDMSPWLVLVLFFSGVYTGKVTTLYLYGKWAIKLRQKTNNTGLKKDLFVGVALALVGLVQSIRFLIT